MTPAPPSAGGRTVHNYQPGEIRVRLDEHLARRGMTLVELAERVGITPVNLSVLKNGRARAIRYGTLAALCRALDCQPGDLLTFHSADDDPADPDSARGSAPRGGPAAAGRPPHAEEEAGSSGAHTT